MRYGKFLCVSSLAAVFAAGFFSAETVRTAPLAYARVPEALAPVRHITEDAAVKVLVDQGHGSGVSLGSGYIVTAAHVVQATKAVQVETKDGVVAPAEVLWLNKAYDIAMLHTSARILPATLSCAPSKVGEQIVAVGNPVDLDFIVTTGKVASEPREFAPNWKSAFVTDMTTVMGASGGPVFDEAGFLVGITVGVKLAQVGFSSSILGYGFVVPSRVVCELMGRGV